MENEDIFLAEKKNGEGKCISCGGIEKQMEKAENIWRRKNIWSTEKKKNGEGKEEKISEKVNVRMCDRQSL